MEAYSGPRDGKPQLTLVISDQPRVTWGGEISELVEAVDGYCGDREGHPVLLRSLAEYLDGKRATVLEPGRPVSIPVTERFMVVEFAMPFQELARRFEAAVRGDEELRVALVDCLRVYLT